MPEIESFTERIQDDLFLIPSLLFSYSLSFVISKGRSRYYLGRVVRVRSNGTFDLDYDDGEKEIGVDRSLIRLIREVTEPLLLPQKNTITDLLNSSLSDITSR